jgi:TonB-linked SusC/RagA family outer membrane protein
MKLKFNRFLVLVFALISQLALAQEKNATGVVTDVSGLPLPGVNVVIKGTSRGVQTDFDGKFKISAKEGETLVFSFISMKTIEMKASTNMVVKLQDDSVKLADVVVTALGLKREKKSLGYATQEIKAADLNSGAGNGNFLNDLSGKVSGVAIRRNNNFGGSTNIVSRGVKSLTGDNQMLIVIDGTPVNNSNVNSNTGSQTTGRGTTYDYGNAAADINPDDIESVNILKGAAASALYGYLAGNGVVIITTKKGKSGKNGAIGVTITSELISGAIDKTTFPTYQNKYGAGYGPFYEDPSGLFLYRDIDGDGNDDLVVPTSEDASYGAAFDPNLKVYNWNAFTPYSDNYNKATPWVAAENGPITFFQTPLSFSNSLALEGGTDKSSFVLNYNNYKQNGIMPNSELKKNSLSAKVTHEFNDKLTGSAFASFTAQSTIGRNSTGYNDNIMSTFRQWWQTNVDVQELKQVYERSGGQNVTWNWADPANLKPIYWDNPYFTRFQNYQSDERNRFTGYGKLDYKVASWFDVTGKLSTDTYSELREERRAAGSVASEFGINRLDETSGYQKYNRSFSEQNYELFLNFKKNITEKFSFTGLLGGSARRTRTTTTLTSTQGGLIVPGLYSLSNSVASVPFPLETEINNAVNSYFGSVSFGYNDNIFLDGTVRRDAFSTLPKDANSLYTKSASLSYVFSKNINAKWLDFGKLRGSYAENPQGQIDDFSLQDTYIKVDPFGSNQQYSVASTKNNPNLRPVKTTTKEVGIEAQFLKKRVGFDVSYYRSLSIDQIFPVSFSTATGNSSRYVNAGSVENKGIEVQLNITPVRTENFQWDVFVNWSQNRNQVVSLNEEIKNLQLGSFQGGVTINASVGQPYGTIQGTDFTYLNGQKVVGTNGRYVINTATNNVIGNINPDWIGGIRNKVTYKNISLGFLIDSQKGGDIFSLDQSYGLATGLYDITAGTNDLGNPIRNTIANGGGVILEGVQADGTPNTIRTPSPNQYGNVSGYRRAPNKAFIYDASYIKLREVNITYSLPSKLAASMKLVDMKFSIIGSNLWIIDKNLPYADPESGLSSGNLSSGYSAGSLPTTRNIGFNVTLKF